MVLVSKAYDFHRSSSWKEHLPIRARSLFTTLLLWFERNVEDATALFKYILQKDIRYLNYTLDYINKKL